MVSPFGEPFQQCVQLVPLLRLRVVSFKQARLDVSPAAPFLFDFLLVIEQTGFAGCGAVLVPFRDLPLKDMFGKGNDRLVAAIVRVQLLDVVEGRRKGIVCLHALHDRVVCVSETIYGLFRVAHDEETAPLGQRVIEKGEKVLPLYGRCILKLVDQIMIDRFSQTEVHVRHPFVA